MSGDEPTIRVGNLQDLCGRMTRDYGQLAERWRETRQHWPDGVAESFEREHLREVGPTLRRLMTELQSFTDEARQAANELRDDGDDPSSLA